MRNTIRRDLKFSLSPAMILGDKNPAQMSKFRISAARSLGVTFKLFDKIKVLGEDRSPLYERLINNSVTEKGDVKWNFEKFLISKMAKLFQDSGTS